MIPIWLTKWGTARSEVIIADLPRMVWQRNWEFLSKPDLPNKTACDHGTAGKSALLQYGSHLPYVAFYYLKCALSKELNFNLT